MAQRPFPMVQTVLRTLIRRYSSLPGGRCPLRAGIAGSTGAVLGEGG